MSSFEVKPISTLTVGVLGAGTMSSQVHLPALLALPNVAVAWVVDRDGEQAQRIARAYRLKAVALPENPANLPHADVVLVGVPYGAREPYYPALAAHGAAVYIEKPFARSLAQHDLQAAMFPASHVAVGYQKRSSGIARALSEAIRTKLFGELRSMRVEFGRPGVATGGRYSTNLALAGGGVLFEVGVHPLDFALHVSDAAAVRIDKGRMETNLGFDVHTEAEATVTTHGGRDVGLELLITNYFHTTMDVLFRFEHALVRVEPFGEAPPEVTPNGSSLSFSLGGENATFPRSAGQMVRAHWQTFLDGVRSGQPNVTSASNTRVTTALVEALYALGGV